MGFTVSFILQWTVYNTDNVWHEGKRYICKQSPYYTKIFVYNFHYIYFSKTIPSKNIYLWIAALYINTAVSFKSNIAKIYYCWPPIIEPI